MVEFKLICPPQERHMTFSNTTSHLIPRPPGPLGPPPGYQPIAAPQPAGYQPISAREQQQQRPQVPPVQWSQFLNPYRNQGPLETLNNPHGNQGPLLNPHRNHQEPLQTFQNPHKNQEPLETLLDPHRNQQEPLKQDLVWPEALHFFYDPKVPEPWSTRDI